MGAASPRQRAVSVCLVGFTLAILVVTLLFPAAHSLRLPLNKFRAASSQSPAGPFPSLRKLSKDRSAKATPEEIAKLFRRIQDDLAPWAESGITLQMVERTYCSTFHRSFRLQIIKGEVFIVGETPGWTEFQRYIKLSILQAHRRYQLPDVDVLISTDDGCPHLSDNIEGPCKTYGPVLAYDRRAEEKHCVLYPDHTFLGWPSVQLPSWDETRALLRQHQTKKWSERTDRLFFHGSQTGNRLLLADDPRVKESEDMEIRVGGWSEGREAGQYISIPEHCDYRYLLQLPGFAYSARLKYLLLCNSTVLFAANGYEEFWYHMLEDDVHVAMVPPLNGNDRGGPLLDKMRQLKQDPKQSQQIAETGYDLVYRILTPKNVNRYFAEVLRQYASLQRFKPQKHPDAIPLAVSALRPDGNVKDLGPVGRTCEICALVETPYMEDINHNWGS